jgi:nitrite reductase/ring-hydroxylating ferredoxin subunit
MDDSVRVTVEDDEESEVVRIDGSAGEVTAGGATFRFGVDGGGTERETDGGAVVDGTEGAEADVDPCYVAPVEDVPSGGTLRFEAITGRRRIDGILQRLGDGSVVAWENSCPHKPEVKLDRGLGALVNGDQLVCHEHGARFDRDDGYCTRGPCRGRSLSPIGVATRDGAVYLTDERFESGRRLD